MTRDKARRVLIPVAICVALLGALLILTSNLDDVALGPGRPSSEDDSIARSGGSDGRGGLAVDMGFVRHLLFLAFTASLTIVFLGALFTRFLRRWLYFAIGLFGALLVFDLVASRLPSTTDLGPDEATRDRVVVASAEPESAGWSRVLAAAGLSLGTCAVLFLGSSWVAARWRAHRSRRADWKLAWQLDQLAVQATSAGRSADLVFRCYREMVDLLSRGERVAHAALTPREFADRLRNLGLRIEAVDRLTELFELVRYGHRESRPFAEGAVASLEEIRRSNRSAAASH